MKSMLKMFMQFLLCINFRVLHVANAFDHRQSVCHRSVEGHMVGQRSDTDRRSIGNFGTAFGSDGDHQLDVAVLQFVHNVRTAFGNLVHHIASVARFANDLSQKLHIGARSAANRGQKLPKADCFFLYPCLSKFYQNVGFLPSRLIFHSLHPCRAS